MWRAGQDPALRMTVGNLVILERLPDIDELVARLHALAHEAPRLAWRLDDPSRSRPRPSWVAEVDFDCSMALDRKAVDVTPRFVVAAVKNDDQFAGDIGLLSALDRIVNAF